MVTQRSYFLSVATNMNNYKQDSQNSDMDIKAVKDRSRQHLGPPFWHPAVLPLPLLLAKAHLLSPPLAKAHPLPPLLLSPPQRWTLP